MRRKHPSKSAPRSLVEIFAGESIDRLSRVFLTMIPPTAVLSTRHRISIFVGAGPLTLGATGDEEDGMDINSPDSVTVEGTRRD